MTEKPEMPDEIWAWPRCEAYTDGWLPCESLGSTHYIRKSLTPPQDVLLQVYKSLWPVNFIYAEEPTPTSGDFEKGAQLSKAKIRAMQEALALLSPYVTRQQENE